MRLHSGSIRSVSASASQPNCIRRCGMSWASAASWGSRRSSTYSDPCATPPRRRTNCWGRRAPTRKPRWRPRSASWGPRDRSSCMLPMDKTKSPWRGQHACLTFCRRANSRISGRRVILACYQPVPRPWPRRIPPRARSIIRRILDGEPGPCRDTVVAGTAAALLLVGRAESLSDGVSQAAEAIDSEAALQKLAALRAT